MLTVTSVIGNIFHDTGLMAKFEQASSAKSCERITIPRPELERVRMRKRTDAGTDIGLVLDSGLHHGDVIVDDADRFIVIEQMPEKILCVDMRPLDGKPESIVALGHMIGNRHKPVAVNGDVLSFPIQSESEAETFKSLLSAVNGSLEFHVKEQIFQPQSGMNVHEH